MSSSRAHLTLLAFLTRARANKDSPGPLARRRDAKKLSVEWTEAYCSRCQLLLLLNNLTTCAYDNDLILGQDGDTVSYGMHAIVMGFLDRAEGGNACGCARGA
jgi:hypothetical protein